MNRAQGPLPLNGTPPANPRFGRYVAAAALAFAALLGVGGPALAVPPSDVIVEDTAGILDEDTLVPAVRDTAFRDPTKVVVFTERGDYDDNFNERVLAHAREKHPEWLSPDGQKWADGLYVVAIDPDGRHIGTYMGEDRKVSPSARESIKDSAKDLLADAQWTDGALEAVQSGARVINRPWYLHPGLLAASGIVVFSGVGTVLWVLFARRNNRRKFAAALSRGDASYANVTLELEVTELNARTIPAESTYGSRVLERYRSFLATYTELTGQRRELGNLPRRARSRKEGVQQADAYVDAAAMLDKLDDVIDDANALLNLSSQWDGAWDRQTNDLREDLEGIDEVLTESAADSSEPTAAALLSFRDGISSDLRAWGAGLADGSMNPDEALDALREARGRLSGLLRDHAHAMIATYAKSAEEEELMRDALDTAQSKSSRPRSRRTSILTASYPGVYYWSAASIHTGYSAGQSSVSSARSSSSSGYGASGGSFSGSGSSSHF